MSGFEPRPVNPNTQPTPIEGSHAIPFVPGFNTVVYFGDTPVTCLRAPELAHRAQRNALHAVAPFYLVNDHSPEGILGLHHDQSVTVGMRTLAAKRLAIKSGLSTSNARLQITHDRTGGDVLQIEDLGSRQVTAVAYEPAGDPEFTSYGTPSPAIRPSPEIAQTIHKSAILKDPSHQLIGLFNGDDTLPRPHTAALQAAEEIRSQVRTWQRPSATNNDRAEIDRAQLAMRDTLAHTHRFLQHSAKDSATSGIVAKIFYEPRGSGFVVAGSIGDTRGYVVRDMDIVCISADDERHTTERMGDSTQNMPHIISKAVRLKRGDRIVLITDRIHQALDETLIATIVTRARTDEAAATRIAEYARSVEIGEGITQGANGDYATVVMSYGFGNTTPAA